MTRHDVAPPTAPGARRSIAIEDVLKSRTKLSDLARTLFALFGEMPARATAIAVLAVLTVSEVALQVGLAWLGKSLLDGALPDASGATPEAGAATGLDAGTVTIAAVLLVAVLAVVWLRQAWQESRALRWRGAAVERLSRHIADGSLEDLAAVPMAALREIIMTDAPYLTRFAVETFAQLVVLGLWSIAAIGFLALYGAPLLAVLGFVVALCALIFGVGARRHLALTGERFQRTAALSQAARDVVEVERVMLTRQFGLGRRFVHAFHAAHGAFHDVALRQALLSAGIRSGLAVLNAVAFLGLVLVGARFIASGTLQPGVLLAALFIVGQLLAAVLQTGDLAGRMAEAATAGRRLSVYWDADDAAAPRRVVSADEPVTGVAALDAQGLTFGYGARVPVFEHVDVTLRHGEIACLTAETGAGKSTFARVLCGLLPPDAGRVTATCAATDTRVDIGALPPGSVLYLGAQPIALPGSLRDNLFLDDGHGPLPDAAAFDAVRLALSHDGVPLDWDAPLIDASGAGLSSGQAQLLQLARAVVREPSIVVFDEATSSLDMASERRVQDALTGWCRRRICLVVSHRACPWLDAAEQRLSW